MAAKHNAYTSTGSTNSPCYDTNSLRLITPRLCTYNCNVNRPYTHIANINRMFMVDMTYMPGYFIEEYPHKYYTNRAASWNPGNRPLALPPGLTKAGLEEKQQLQEYMKKQRSHNKRKEFIGNQKIRVNPPSLGLLKGPYKRPLTMYDLDADDTAALPKNTEISKTASNYSIFPALRKSSTTTQPETDILMPRPRQSYHYTAGKRWNMDRFKMWSGGTEGSVEFPQWKSPSGNERFGSGSTCRFGSYHDVGAWDHARDITNTPSNKTSTIL